MKFSPIWSLEQVTASRTATRLGIANIPNSAQIANTQQLWMTLTRVVELVGDIFLSSVFRCAELNTAVGSGTTSAHLDGRAADWVPATTSLAAAFSMLATSDLPYDQLIMEHDTTGAAWIHLGISRAWEAPRRDAMTATGSPGAMTFRLANG